jgi:hypothetical protein
VTNPCLWFLHEETKTLVDDKLLHQRRAAVFHRAAIATQHHDVVAAVNERVRHRGEVVDRRQQPREYPVAHSLRAPNYL